MERLIINKAKSSKVMDEIIKLLNLKNDAVLAKRLGVYQPVVSKIRAGELPVGPTLWISIHEETNWSIATVKEKLGFPAKQKNCALPLSKE